MRLNDKLIRKNCPSCGGEITLESSSLDKKINCPKCRQTVVIPNGHHTPPKPAPSKKRKPAEKRNGGHALREETPPTPLAPTMPAPPEKLRVSIQRRDSAKAESRQPAVEVTAEPGDKRAIVYCICNGVLKRCHGDCACCVKPEFCVYADEFVL